MYVVLGVFVIERFNCTLDMLMFLKECGTIEEFENVNALSCHQSIGIWCFLRCRRYVCLRQCCPRDKVVSNVVPGTPDLYLLG